MEMTNEEGKAGTVRERVLVMLSGGVTSSIMFMDCLRRGYEVIAVTFIKDGAHREQNKERDAAKILAAYNDVQHIMVDLSSFRRLTDFLELSEQVRKGEQPAMPDENDGEYDAQAPTKELKPYPHETMLGMAETIGKTLGIEKIFAGDQNQKKDMQMLEIARAVGLPLDREWCPWKSLIEQIVAEAPKEDTQAPEAAQTPESPTPSEEAKA